MVSQALRTLTSRMALRVTRLSVDLEPNVATSHIVATPYLRSVRTTEWSAKQRGGGRVPTRCLLVSYLRVNRTCCCAEKGLPVMLGMR